MIQSELDILRDLSFRLGSANIDYMLTGSMAMNYYAQPRMTRDIDLVVALTSTDAERIVDIFSKDYYVSLEAVKRAILRRSMFNLIHEASVIKVDFIILKNDPFRREEFDRRREIKIADFMTKVVSREDLILSKLYWARDTRSELQLKDVSNLLSSECDLGYLRSKAEYLCIVELLEEVIRK